MSCRCLIGQTDMAEVVASVKELILLIPDDQRTEDSLYRERLAACLECGRLRDGVCGECGCFVELRAAKRRMHCPSAEKRW